jgi:hypothetical protein
MWLRIVLFIALSPGVAMQLEGQSKGKPTYQQAPADAKATQSQEAQRGVKGSPIFVDIEQHPKSQAEAAKDEEQNKRKEFYDQLTAGSAVVAAICTVLLVIVGYYGVRAAVSTLQAIKIQTNAIIEAQRPQIAIDPNGDALRMLTYPLMDPSATPRIVLDIFNRGVTPARNLTYETWIEILPRPFVEFTSNVDHEPPSTPVVLTQGHPIGANIPIRKPVTKEQLESVKALNLQACVRLRVVYDDAFNKGRCVNFGFIVMYNGLSFLPKYNGECVGSEKS